MQLLPVKNESNDVTIRSQGRILDSTASVGLSSKASKIAFKKFSNSIHDNIIRIILFDIDLLLANYVTSSREIFSSGRIFTSPRLIFIVNR